MSITTQFINQPSDEFSPAQASKWITHIFGNPKLVAAYMMQSMMEGHIDMCADYTLTTDEIESNLSAQAMRECTAAMFDDYMNDLKTSVAEAMADPEFCKTQIYSITLNRNDNGTYAMEDADVRMVFDFKNKRHSSQ